MNTPCRVDPPAQFRPAFGARVEMAEIKARVEQRRSSALAPLPVLGACSRAFYLRSLARRRKYEVAHSSDRQPRGGRAHLFGFLAARTVRGPSLKRSVAEQGGETYCCGGAALPHPPTRIGLSAPVRLSESFRLVYAFSSCLVGS